MSEEEYIVDKVVGKKIESGIEYYLVKWKDYPEEDNTWEPKNHFKDLTPIEEYENKRKKKNNKILEQKEKEKKIEFLNGKDNNLNNNFYLGQKRKKNLKNIINSEEENDINKNEKEGILGKNSVKKIKCVYQNSDDEKNPFFLLEFENVEGNEIIKDNIFSFEDLIKFEPELIARYLMEKCSFKSK